MHTELGGQILENKEEAQRLAAGQMLDVEAVIKMLDSTFNLRWIAVARRRTRWFKRGTLYRKALDVLRTVRRS